MMTQINDSKRFRTLFLVALIVLVALIIYGLLRMFVWDDGARPITSVMNSVQQDETVTYQVVSSQLSANRTPRVDQLINQSFAEWQALGGSWTFAENRAEQSDVNQPDMALVYAENPVGNTQLDVTFKAIDNYGAGIFFGMGSPDSLHDSHLVRFETTGDAIFWGRFDKAGVFKGQGYAPVVVDFSQPQQLSIVLGDSDYQILLNGELLVDSVPLYRPTGYFALTTTYSHIQFSDLAVIQNGIKLNASVSDTTCALGEGKWAVEEEVGQVVGAADELSIHSLDVLASTYTLESVISFDDLADGAGDETAVNSSGGFIFHMSAPENKCEAKIVRFADNGERIVWGTVDNDGIFINEGSAAVAMSGEDALLAINVQDEQYDILIDGEVVADELPLTDGQGWIGLVVNGGTATFDAIRLLPTP